MNGHHSDLARQYSATLLKFATSAQEEALAQAYGLGRAAIAGGLGVLDMVRLHQASLDALYGMSAPCEKGDARDRVGNFFLETLAPFEVTHRGFRETNEQLHEALEALERRNEELAVANQKLIAGIREREKTAKALRESKDHYRKLFKQARVMHQDLRRLSDRFLHAQEEERKRISRELHDETSQALTMISITLATLRDGVEDPESRRRRVQNAQGVLQETMQSLHDFAVELRPASLDELGLLPALRSWLKKFAQRTGLHVSFRADPAVEELDETRKTTFYRIVQESFSNIAKHARASRVELDIRRTPRSVCLKIDNDGKPYCPDEGRRARGRNRLGLLGMQERVRLVHGKLSIKPRPENGTVMRVTVPLKKTARVAAAVKNFPPEPQGEERTDNSVRPKQL